MSHAYSLAHLTALPLTPPELVDAAASAGYGYVGVRMLPPAPGVAAYPLMENGAMLRETLARLKGTGVGVFDIEIVRLNERFDPGQFLPFLDAGAQLGARAILVVGDDRDPARLARSFASFCEAAKRFGMSANIEFMPWTAVPDASAAVRLVNAAGRPDNAGVLIDAIHYERSATRLDEIAALPRSWLHYAQLSDSPAGIPDSMEEILRQARYERLLPGEGGIDLRGLLSCLPADLPLSLEVWDEARAPAIGLREWTRRAIDAARAVAGSVRGQSDPQKHLGAQA